MKKSNNLVHILWIPWISLKSIEFHYFRGHAAVVSTNFVDKYWIPLFSWNSKFFSKNKNNNNKDKNKNNNNKK